LDATDSDSWGFGLGKIAQRGFAPLTPFAASFFAYLAALFFADFLVAMIRLRWEKGLRERKVTLPIRRRRNRPIQNKISS